MFKLGQLYLSITKAFQNEKLASHLLKATESCMQKSEAWLKKKTKNTF